MSVHEDAKNIGMTVALHLNDEASFITGFERKFKMNRKNFLKCLFTSLTSIITLFLTMPAYSQSSLNCKQCHPTEFSHWLLSRHSNTQKDVANELATNWNGQTPDSVISGSQAEDCIACHSPTAVSVNGGMTETQAMAFFFTTLNSKYTTATDTANSALWPNVYCTGCHNVPSNHPSAMPIQMVFNSKTAKYDSVKNVSALCGNCHGNLRFSNTDHLLYNGWLLSRHGHKGQYDVAGELSVNDIGLTPAQVTADENCIACHAPTSVQINGGISEAQALATFFSVDINGKFSRSTTVLDTAEWADVACNACHDPHHPDTLSYFNSSTRSYQLMNNSNQLCGQCHGNLRFASTDHLSYNIEEGTGGVGISDTKTMPGTKCVDCHMYRSTTDGTNSKMLGGHSWQVFIKESDGTTTMSCTKCHSGLSLDSALTVITAWKKEFASLDSMAQIYVNKADSILAKQTATSLDSSYVAEATANMTFAEGDESGGFHNHKYSVALLNDAIAKARSVITGITISKGNMPLKFELWQNFPNPFNPSTTITFGLPEASKVRLEVYDILGQRVALLINSDELAAGTHRISFDGSGLPSGIYFYKIWTPHFSQVKKMLLLK